jgi:dUTP pyrophosphatase
MFDLDKMKARVLEIADPSNPYTQEDFNEEFNVGTISVNPDLHKIKFEFKNESDNQDPEYATNGSSGFDLRANLVEPIVMYSGEVSIIPTGLYFKIPDNFEIQVRPRSGLAAKNGVTVLNTPGTVDADYRGEVKVILINHGKSKFTINHGDRIAQAVIASVFAKNVINLSKVDSISEDTERGSGGFGSTGKN